MTGSKRWTALVIALALILAAAVFPVDTASAAALSFGVTYKSETVNLRQQPTQYSTRLGSYAKGSWMAIAGESGNWYYVTAPDGKTGYMSKNYVSVSQTPYGNIGIVTNPKASSFLNLREKPSYSAKVLGIYYNGAPFILLSYSEGWYNVRVNGVEGYFREEYVTRQFLPYSEDVATIVTPNNTALNLRSGPGMGYPSVAQFYGGKYVMVLQRGTGWWKVAVDGMEGFMNTAFLKEGLLPPGTSQQNASAGQTGAQGYAVVTNPRATQVLNMRESPSKASRVLGQYKNGARVTVLSQGVEWCKVRNAADVVGYMMTDYLALHNLPDIPEMKVVHPMRTFVNLRSAPSMETGKVLARVPHNASVTVLIPGESWIKVRYNGQTGYMVSQFLQ